MKEQKEEVLWKIDLLFPVKMYSIFGPLGPVRKPSGNPAIFNSFHREIGLDIQDRRTIFGINKGSVDDPLLRIDLIHLDRTEKNRVGPGRGPGTEDPYFIRGLFEQVIGDYPVPFTGLISEMPPAEHVEVAESLNPGKSGCKFPFQFYGGPRFGAHHLSNCL